MKYLGAASSMDLEPHIYALGLNAVKGLQQYGGTSQALPFEPPMHRSPFRVSEIEGKSAFSWLMSSSLHILHRYHIIINIPRTRRSFISHTRPILRPLMRTYGQNTPLLPKYGSYIFSCFFKAHVSSHHFHSSHPRPTFWQPLPILAPHPTMPLWSESDFTKAISDKMRHLAIQSFLRSATSCFIHCPKHK